MTSILGIDSDVWVIILTIIIAIETLYLIIQEKRKSSSGIEPVTADLFKDILKKVPNAKTEDDFLKLADQKADEKIENIKKEIFAEMKASISKISRKTRETDAQISKIETSAPSINVVHLF
jgi:hypothetical protein